MGNKEKMDNRDSPVYPVEADSLEKEEIRALMVEKVKVEIVE